MYLLPFVVKKPREGAAVTLALSYPVSMLAQYFRHARFTPAFDDRHPTSAT
jgi:hypothetical protein